jgi:hypothetical protein
VHSEVVRVSIKSPAVIQELMVVQDAQAEEVHPYSSPDGPVSRIATGE